MFSSTPREVEETSTSALTSKIEKTKSEINEVQKLEKKKIKNKIKTINVISSKVDKQVFFYVIDKINDEETQKKIIYKT